MKKEYASVKKGLVHQGRARMIQKKEPVEWMAGWEQGKRRAERHWNGMEGCYVTN